MSNSPRITERQSLDRALVEAGRSTDPATRAQAAAFEAMLRVRGQRPAPRGPSLREEIDRLVMPEIEDPGIFGAARSLDLLGYVIDTIIPSLGADDDIAAIAEAVLLEEIERRNDVLARLEGVGSP